MPTPSLICALGAHPTVHFAATELARCRSLINGESATAQIETGYRADVPALWVGLNADLPESVVPRTPAVRDTRFDDAVAIRVRDGRGAISGNNPRSVLLAVYRYLRELGCRWVRPGVDGEHLPRGVALDQPVDIVEAPSYRHRCMCIEGSVGPEHVVEMIDWLPKAGMNAYFMQFREGFTFFDRWQKETGGEPLTLDQARANVATVAQEIKRRDLLFHAVGHGWTCDPFGMPGLGWEYPPPPVPDEVVPLLAEVDGVRALWGGIPLNTNLCYSNLEVRARMRDAIADYAQAHPEVDLLHVWLADGSNNSCECANCRDTLPSDFYVMLLNEVDAVLTQRGLPTRIVFLMYVDLLWPPERERLHNPERFVLMFAPITRTYSHAFEANPVIAGAPPPALPAFERNKLVFPRSVDDNVAFLRAWQAAAGSAVEVVDFDYHLMWDHYNDPGNMQTARVLQRDVQQLAELGMDGFISCQVQRASFPTGLSLHAMAATLWNRAQSFDALADDYAAAAFGADGVAARAYLDQITALFDPVYLRGENPDAGAAAAAVLAGVPAHVAAFGPVIARNRASSDACHAASWRYLQLHGEFAVLFAEALRLRALGQAEPARAAWQALQRWLDSQRVALQHVFDGWVFGTTLDRRFA